MHGVVKIHGLNSVYFLKEVPEEGDNWKIEEGAWVEVPSDIADWPDETDSPPPPTLAVSKSDPKKYRMFKRPEEVEPAGFEPTGMSYGGVYSPRQWERLVEAIPFMRSFEAIKGNDPPGAMDEALRSIRGAR
jgi:hypothetical protein